MSMRPIIRHEKYRRRCWRRDQDRATPGHSLYMRLEWCMDRLQEKLRPRDTSGRARGNNDSTPVTLTTGFAPPPHTCTHLQHPERLVNHVGVELLVLRHVHNGRRRNATVTLGARDAEHAQKCLDSPARRRGMIFHHLMLIDNGEKSQAPTEDKKI